MTAGEPPGDPRPGAPKGLAALFTQLNTPREDGVHPLWAAVGGLRGAIDSSLPTTAFVIVDIAASTRTAIIAAVATAAVLLLLRVVRREALQQGLSGLFAVAVAAFVATRLRSGSGYFLPGILLQVPYVIVAIGSVLIGRPIVGYIAAIADTSFAHWRSERPQRRAASYATLIWGAVFAARIAVMVPLYLADRTAALGVAKLAMGWPLWAVAAGASVMLMRRAGGRQDAPSSRPS